MQHAFLLSRIHTIQNIPDFIGRIHGTLHIHGNIQILLSVNISLASSPYRIASRTMAFWVL